MSVVIIGAGIAGLACARELVSAGVPARVLERDTVVGGRLASEKIDGRPVDTGAAYVTADDPAFEGRLQSWRIAGLARPWTDTFRNQRGPATLRWSAPAGLRSLAEDLAAGLDVTLGTEVTALPRAEYVVLAMPGPQALRIAGDLAAARDQEWSAVTTAVLTYPERTWKDFRGVFVADDPAVTTICDDGDRRGDRAPVLVAHGRPGHEDELPATVGRVLGIRTEPSVTLRHWPYATPRAGGPETYARRGNVFLCGDAFGRPRVQTAWASGRAVAATILRSRQGSQSTER